MTSQWERQRSARKRLEGRYGTDIGTPERPIVLLHPVEAVEQVCLAIAYPDSPARRPDVTEQDVADTLLQVEEARENAEQRLDYNELLLLDRLRAAGWSWDRIAEHRGMRTRQHAYGRWTHLREKCPSYKPVSDGPSWFGRLLPWRRRNGEWGTTYLGRTYRIKKIGREFAEAIGGGCKPGWHFAFHPDWRPEDGPPNPIGPGLGSKVDAAKRKAEVWIITDQADRQGPWDDAPDLVAVMGGGGAGFGSATSRTLVTYPDHEQARITVHGDSPKPFQRGELLGTITPTFAIPEQLPIDAADEPVRITWTPRVGDVELDACGSWRDAARAFGAAISGRTGGPDPGQQDSRRSGTPSGQEPQVSG